jgi:uncharacterized membrane protein YccF (DUF307 family)
MNAHPTVGRELANGVGRFAAHALAIVLGLILSVAGLAMGVSIALLPIGIPLGLAGLLLLMWGLFGGVEEHKLPSFPAEKR